MLLNTTDDNRGAVTWTSLTAHFSPVLFNYLKKRRRKKFYKWEHFEGSVVLKQIHRLKVKKNLKKTKKTIMGTSKSKYNP